MPDSPLTASVTAWMHRSITPVVCTLATWLLLSAAHFTQAQTWSEPAVIYTANKYSGYPDFTIDNNGDIHCVWSTRHGTNFYVIYYSSSGDDGETWSAPISASLNNTMWMTLPHIVSAQDNTLHLTYDYNVGNLYNSYIFHRIFDGISWVFADTVTKAYPGATKNRLVIDNNDKLYSFWFTGYYTGYQTLDPGAATWSEINWPYGFSMKLFTNKTKVGSDNVIHFLGRSHLNGNKGIIAYFKLCEGEWHPIEKISNVIRTYGYDMALDNQDLPHIVWQQFNDGYYPGEDSIMYSYYNGYFWSEPELIVQDANKMSIAVDPNNDIHLLLNVKEDNIYRLKHYIKSSGNWELPQTLEENDYFFMPEKTIYRDGKLYHLYGRTDTLISSINIYTSILMRKLDILTTDTDSNKSLIDDLIIAPNPFRFSTKIGFGLQRREKIIVQVYSIYGVPVNTLLNAVTEPGRIELTWDGTDSNGNKVPKGFYIVRVQSDKEIRSKKLELIY